MKKRRFSNRQKREILRWEDSVKFLITVSLINVTAYADIPTGMIGGTTSSSNAYSAFISSNGNPIPISDLPLNGQINSVALNDFGVGLIGGQDGLGGYAAFVSSDGMLNPLNLNLAMGTILTSSINRSGNGIVGGNDSSFTMYAALVLQDGTITPLSTPLTGFIRSTALNDDGIALIGGEGGTFPYAAYVTTEGVVNQIDTTPLEGGHLVVAMNALGNGIIGGSSTMGAYAALVTPSGVTPTPLSPLPSGLTSFISGVAINDSGMGIIGGNDDSANMYAGYSTPTGDVTPLFDSPTPGQILSVAINKAGTGLIGGYSNSNLYAALVQPDGNINSLIPGSIGGTINSVALNDAGVGLIGGQSGSEGYAALIAPNGALTLLDMSSQNNISSVDLNNIVATNNIIDSVTPQSIGPYSSGFYTQLAAAAALESRFIEQNRIWTKRRASQTNIAQGELAYNEEALLGQNFNIVPRIGEYCTPQKQNTLWIAPFGNYIHLKAQGSIPSYTNEIGGVLLAYDHQNSNYLVGASAGYAFNYIDYSQDLGHSKLQEEMLCLYGAYYRDHFWFDAALWGGLYQLSNVRHTLSIITSKSSTHGWILSPHLEMASPWAIGKKERYFIEPFFMLDWVNSWQDHYTEKGSSGFNLQIGNLYSSLLQSEAGLRFYEKFDYRWGDICLEEKLSYVNQAPFHLNSVSTSFVSSASSFPVAVGSTRVENLGSAQLISSFVPRNHSYPFGGFAIQVTANGDYQSYFASVFSGIDF